jgi:hypothetical protein
LLFFKKEYCSKADVYSGGMLSVNAGTTINFGTVLFSNAGTISGAGSFANNGSITHSSSGSSTISTPFQNNAIGNVNITSGTLTISGSGTLQFNW